MTKRYAQLNAAGIVAAVVDTAGDIDHPRCLLVTDGDDVLGMQWDGAAFVAAPVDRRAQIAAALAEIDRKAGMPRLLRETLIAIGGTAVPAILKTHETSAAALRAELAGLK